MIIIFHLFILILIEQHIKRLRRTTGHRIEQNINQDQYVEQINCDLKFVFSLWGYFKVLSDFQMAVKSAGGAAIYLRAKLQ